MPSYPTTGTTKAKAPAPKACRGCSAASGNPLQRHLCDSCYANATIRSQFNSFGQKVAAPPLPPPRDHGDNGISVKLTGKRKLDAEQLTALQVGFSQEARDRHDDDTLFSAVARLSADARYVEDDTGEPAAGVNAAASLAGLTLTRGAAAIERLVQAGRLARVTVRHRREGSPKAGGRPAAGLRLVKGGPAPESSVSG
jgi:hypothetical protein